MFAIFPFYHLLGIRWGSVLFLREMIVGKWVRRTPIFQNNICCPLLIFLYSYEKLSGLKQWTASLGKRIRFWNTVWVGSANAWVPIKALWFLSRPCASPKKQCCPSGTKKRRTPPHPTTQNQWILGVWKVGGEVIRIVPFEFWICWSREKTRKSTDIFLEFQQVYIVTGSSFCVSLKT